MRGYAIGKVLASKAPSVAPGTYVTCSTGWTELSIQDAKAVNLVSVTAGRNLTDELGVLHGTGLTAYFGITDIGQVKAGDFVVVSGAAGATGSVACQIAKLKGATVLGLAGSDDKVQWLKELGCDEALNYKDPEFKQKFKEATKNLIDVFFDNVGGEILELALSRAKPHARFVMCGAISQYNTSQPVGPKVGAIRVLVRREG
jgi:NADPH-dependent curcumin reductase CurA